jgi:hypothetical protein
MSMKNLYTIVALLLLLAAQVCSQTPTDGLVAWYPLDGTAADSAGSGLDGIPGGGVAWVPDRDGTAGRAAYFDGVDDWIDLNSHPSTPFMTVSLWLKTTANNNYGAFSWESPDGDPVVGIGVGLYQEGDPHTTASMVYGDQIGGSPWPRLAGKTYLTDGRWHHIVFVYDGDAYLYVDGVLEDSSDRNSEIPAGTVSMGLGWLLSNPGFRYTGSIDEVRIYNRGLVKTEIDSLYHENGWGLPRVVAYYPFNGDAGDSSGSGNHGTITGAGVGEDRFGNLTGALSFDGADDFVMVPDNPSLTPPQLSLSAWVYYTGGFESPRIISKGPVDGYEMMIWQPGGDMLSAQINGTTFFSDNWVPRNRWVHLVMTKDRDSLRYYMNGARVHAFALDHLNISTENLVIGANSYDQAIDRFSGRMDDLRIYNYPLPTSEIDSLYHESGWDLPRVVAYYPFNGDAGDSSGTGNHGTINGAVAGYDRFGDPAGSLSFDGLDDYVRILDHPTLTPPQMSISAWIYSTGGSENPRILSKGSADGYDLLIYRYVGGVLTGAVNGVDFQSDDTIPMNRWVHVVATKGSDSLRFYVDGTAVHSFALDQLTVSASDLIIGANTAVPLGDWFKGRIDDVRLYNYALSESDVIGLVNERGYGPPAITVTPGSISGNLLSGQSNTQQVTIRNSGAGALEYKISIRPGQVSPTTNAVGVPDVKKIKEEFLSPVKGKAVLQADRPAITEAEIDERFRTLEPLEGAYVDPSIRIMVLNWFWGSAYLDALGLHYTAVDESGFLSANLDQFDVIFLGMWGTGGVETVLNQRKSEIEAFLRRGGGFVSLDALGYSFLPVNMGAPGGAGQTVDLIHPDHPIMNGFTGDQLNNWNPSYQSTLRTIDPWLVAIARPDSRPDESVLLAGSYGGGRIVISRLWHYAYFQSGKDEALRLLANFIDWAGRGFTTVSPSAGMIAVADSAIIDVSLHSGGLPSGAYQDTVLIHSNDPTDSTVAVSVNLTVSGAPDIMVQNATIDFWKTYIGIGKVDSFTMHNAGPIDLIITNISSSSGVFTPDIAGMTIPPWTSRVVHIVFMPVDTGVVSGQISITSNDPDSPTTIVEVQGWGRSTLAAYYPFNGDAGDSSGNGNHGVINGAVAGEDRFGDPTGALSFDGSDDYVVVADDSSLNLQQLSISAWVYYGGGTDNPHIVSKGSAGIGGYQLIVYQYGNNVLYGEVDGSSYLTDDRVPTNRWVNLIMTKDGDSVRFFMNGIQVHAFAHTGMSSSPVNLVIGGNSYNLAADRFTGRIDDVRIYARSLRKSEIDSLYHEEGFDPPRIVAYYPFNGDAGDSSGTGNHGTINGAVAGYDRFGDPAGSLSFDGLDDYVRIPDHPTLTPPQMSISAWVNYSGGTENPRIASKRQLDGYEFFIGQDAGGVLAGNINGVTYNTEDTLRRHRWVHVVMTKDRDSLRYYLDGAQIQAFSQDHIAISAADLIIGANSYNPYSQSIKGRIDDLRIYNYALTVAEIDTLLNERGYGPPVASVTPEAISGSLLTGQTSDHRITINNTGPGALEYNITVRPCNTPGSNAVQAPNVEKIKEQLLAPVKDMPALQIDRPVITEADIDERFRNPQPLAGAFVDSSIRILALDWGWWGTSFLDALGLPYTAADQNAFMTVDFDQYDVLFVGLSIWPDLLYQRRADIEDYLNRGGGVVSLNPDWYNRYQWLPLDYSVSDAYGDAVTVCAPEHPVMDGLRSEDLSNWNTSYRLIFTHYDSSLVPLVRPGLNENAATLLAAHYGEGRMVVSGLRHEIYFYRGIDEPLAIIANMINWAGGTFASVNPRSGIVARNSVDTVNVSLSGGLLPSGEYLDTVVVHTNAPVIPTVYVAAHLSVTATSAILITDTALVYGDAYVGVGKLDSFTISNLGAIDLVVSGITSSLAVFAPEVSSVTVPPGTNRVVHVAFIPTDTGMVYGEITVTSNDPHTPVRTIAAEGHGVTAPPGISGTFRVGVGGDYITLKEALDSINVRYLTDTLMLVLTDSAYDEQPLVISPAASLINAPPLIITSVAGNAARHLLSEARRPTIVVRDTGVAAIVLENTSRVQIENLRLVLDSSNYSGYGILLRERCRSVVLSDITLVGNSEHVPVGVGIEMQNLSAVTLIGDSLLNFNIGVYATGAVDLTISSSVIVTGGEGAVFLETWGNEVHIDNNFFEGNDSSYYGVGGSVQTNAMSVDHNFMRGFRYSNISLDEFRGVASTGLVIQQTLHSMAGKLRASEFRQLLQANLESLREKRSEPGMGRSIPANQPTNFETRSFREPSSVTNPHSTISVSGNTMGACGDVSVGLWYVWGEPVHTEVKDNEIVMSNGGWAGILHNSDQGVSTTEIVRNTIHGYSTGRGEVGIEAYIFAAYGRSRIDSNQIDGFTSGITGEIFCDSVSLSGNIINDGGISLHSTGTINLHVEDNNISNINGGVDAGIWLGGVGSLYYREPAQVFVRKNVLNADTAHTYTGYSYGFGIGIDYMEASSIFIDSNSVTGAGEAGIYLSSLLAYDPALSVIQRAANQPPDSTGTRVQLARRMNELRNRPRNLSLKEIKARRLQRAVKSRPDAPMAASMGTAEFSLSGNIVSIRGGWGGIVMESLEGPVNVTVAGNTVQMSEYIPGQTDMGLYLGSGQGWKNSLIQGNTLGNARVGMVLEGWEMVEDASVRILDNTIFAIEDGMYVDGYGMKVLEISGNTIKAVAPTPGSNDVSPSQRGVMGVPSGNVGLMSYPYTEALGSAMIMSGNDIRNFDHGVDSYHGGFETFIISDNRLEENGTGLSWESYCDGRLIDGKIERNVFSRNVSSGADIFLYDYNCWMKIQNNTFSFNGVRGLGLYGDGAMPSVNDNNFLDTSGYSLYNDTWLSIDARRNWWGNASAEMDAKPYPSNISTIYDHFDTSASGFVVYQNWLHGPVGVAGSISGNVWIDRNGNGLQDTVDTGLFGWVIFIDADGNDALDSAETLVVTDSSGNFIFTGLANGSYRIREVQPFGWDRSTVNPLDVTISGDSAVTGLNFGNILLLGIGYTYTGPSGGSWSDPANWSGGRTPNSTAFVYIPEGVEVVVDTLPSDSIRTLEVDFGAKVTFKPTAGPLKLHNRVHNDGIIEFPSTVGGMVIYGDLINHGTVIPGTSTIYFAGNNPKVVLSTEFYNLDISGDNTSTSGTLTVENQLFLRSDLNVRAQDTLIILNDRPDAILASGGTSRGTLVRAIAPAETSQYRLGCPDSYVQFDGSGTYPNTFTITTFPDSTPAESTLPWAVMGTEIDTVKNTIRADSVAGFSRWAIGRPKPQVHRLGTPTVDILYGISLKGGSDILANINLCYPSSIPGDTSESGLVLLKGPVVIDSIMSSWNLLSLPVTPDEDDMDYLFPGGISKAFTYNPLKGYETHTQLKAGVGYFLKFPHTMLVMVPGDALMEDTLQLLRGWNLIGTLSFPIGTISTVPDGILGSPFYSFSKGYIPADSLEPMRGYWIKALEEGELILSADPAVLNKPIPLKTDLRWMEEAGTLRFEDAVGGGQTLYFTPSLGRDSAFFAMPPPGPGVSAVIRYATGRMLEESDAAQERTIPIVITGATYPVNLHWNGGAVVGGAMLRVGGKQCDLKEPGSLTIVDGTMPLSLILSPWEAQPIPTEFTLYQNYPNPFNAVTRIRYDLPEDGVVSMVMYNVAGQEVRTLVHTPKDAGSYELVEDMSDLPSGVYFITLVTGSHRGHLKLVLMK